MALNFNIIFNIFTLFGGLAFFLYGMNVMSSGLEKLAGGKLEGLLKKMTSNPFKSLLLGAGITIAIQSSSAMTVMLVGLVNSGIMEIGQTVGVIMGSNIGTTLTAWLTSLTGIDSDVFLLKMLKPSSFSPIIAFIGIVISMTSHSDKKKSAASIMLGFAILMFGMNLMSDSVDGIDQIPGFRNILVAFNNPLLGVLVGAVVTGIIQSSAASVAILQALAISESGITFGMAIPIIMGQNIGTCVTALISSIGVNKNAKKVAVIHVSFNVIGTAVCLALYYGLDAVFDFVITDMPINTYQIALCHMIFNVFTTVILLPFAKGLVKIANIVIKTTDTENVKGSFIDERLTATPSVAVAECSSKVKEMALIAKEAIVSSINILHDYDVQKHDETLKNEEKLDYYEDKLSAYLVKISSMSLSSEDSFNVSKQLHTIGDFERIGDHAVNLTKTADEIKTKGIRFSDEANREIDTASNALLEILDITINSYVSDDVNLARKVEPLEQVIDGLISEIKINHIERLQSGSCTIELGFILSDMLTNFERVSDHCSNIAVAVIDAHKKSFESHKYLNKVKYSGNAEFEKEYLGYLDKYKLDI